MLAKKGSTIEIDESVDTTLGFLHSSVLLLLLSPLKAIQIQSSIMNNPFSRVFS